MNRLKRIAIAGAATLFVAVFLLCAVFMLRSYKLRASADDGVTEINLADYFAFHWKLTPYETELGDETVYRYQYLQDDVWHDYYTTSPLAAAPDPEWTAWKEVSVTSAVRSVALYRSDGFEPGVAVEFSALPDDCYSVTYGGDCSASGTGEYSAKAVLTLTNTAYRFVYEPQGVELSGRGMSVVIRADGTATVTKTWYVAYSENALLSPKSAGKAVEYTLSSWTFGQFGDREAPRLKRGDELSGKVGQPDGYTLSHDGLKIAEVLNGQTVFYDDDFENGSKDLLTFTLLREGESICENEPRSQWNYYFNDYTPVGSYEVTFTVQSLTVSSHTSWWNAEENFNAGAGGTEFRGVTAVYGFEVLPAGIVLQDETLNQYGKEGAEPFQAEISAFRFGNYSDFFAPATEKLTVSGVIGRAEALVSGTYWGTPVAAEQYFDAIPRLMFRLSGADDGVYRPASADWSGVIRECGLYTVYYKAEMKNYSAAPAIVEESYRHYFRVNVYFERVNLSANLRDGSGNEIGVFVEGAQSNALLSAQFVSSESDGFRDKKLALERAGLEVKAVFEITLKEGDEAVSPAGRVRAGISIPASFQGAENLQLALVNGKGEILILSCTETEGKYVFETDELGILCFVTPLKAGEPAEPNGNYGWIVALCLIGTVAAAETVALAVLLAKKRREKNADGKN